MAILVQEKYKGRVQDVSSAEVTYLVFGTDGDAGNVDDQDAFDAVESSAPPIWDGLNGTNINVKEELVLGTIWEVAVSYGSHEPKFYQQSSIEYEFSYQAESEKITQSIYTRGVYDEEGLIDRESEPDWYNGAINVKDSNGMLTVEGLDLKGGSATNTWVYKPLHADVTTAYQLGVEQLMGSVNTFPLFGRPAGTMRLVSVSGGASFQNAIQPKWSIRFGFEYSRNRYNFYCGDILVGFKKGHDLLWGFYGDVPDSTDSFKEVIKKPMRMYVEQVYFEDNFAPLRLY